MFVVLKLQVETVQPEIVQYQLWIVLSKRRPCQAKIPAAEQLSFHRQLFCDIYQDKAGTLPEQSDLDDDILHKEFNWLRPLYIQPY
jgi:hypothetical protein